jgi:hypothetical protein
MQSTCKKPHAIEKIETDERRQPQSLSSSTQCLGEDKRAGTKHTREPNRAQALATPKNQLGRMRKFERAENLTREKLASGGRDFDLR